MTYRKIEFIPASQETKDNVLAPQPSRLSIPDWYKKTPKSTESWSVELNRVDSNLKACVPFQDALMSGYIQSTWAEITIEKQGSEKIIGSRVPNFFNMRPFAQVPISDEFEEKEFTWIVPYSMRVPKGYSVLITSPFNREDLPWKTLTGVVDADRFHHVRFGNLPFWIKKSFTGVIPIGTPMYQILPFKRENWESTVVEFNQREAKKRMYEHFKIIHNSYRKQFWTKKIFN